MPKSKHKKTRYIPRTTGNQQTAQTNNAAASAGTASVSVSSQSAVATSTVKAASAGSKAAPVFQGTNVAPELKVIGVIAVIIVTAIIVLYFALR